MTLKILHCIPSISSGTGGPPRALVELCRATMLAAPDTSITIATSTSRMSAAWLTAFRQQLPIGTKLLLFQHWGQHTSLIAPRMLVWLARRMRTFDVAHIHAVFHPMSSCAAWIARYNQVPYIIRPLGGLSPYTFHHRRTRLKNGYFRFIEKSNLNAAAALHFTMPGEWDKTRVLGDWKMAVVIPLPYPSAPKVVATEDRSQRQVLFLSRLDRTKGVHLLLEAFRDVSRLLPDARLVIAGSGNVKYERSLRALADTLDLNGRVDFVGFVEGPTKERLLQTSALFVLPSAMENFGIAVVEALAAGLPVIVSEEVDLAPYIQEAQAGLVVKRQVDHLSSSILRVLGDESLRHSMGARGVELVARRFSPDLVGRQLVDLYRSCARGAARPLPPPRSRTDRKLAPHFPVLLGDWLRSRRWLRRPVATLLGSRIVSRPSVAGGKLWFPAGKYLNLYFSRVARIEPEITKAMTMLLRPGDIVFDVGANIGYYTLLASGVVGRSGRVVAVEPDPSNLETLKLNIARNGLTDIVVEPRALSAVSGFAALFQDGTTGRTSSLDSMAWHPDGPSSVQQVEVELITLDQLATRYGPPSLIKCDVEGHEEQVLAGAVQTLAVHPLIFIETVSRSRAAVSRLLAAQNYRFLNSEAPLLGQAPSSTIEWPNCLAFPPERARDIEELCRSRRGGAP